MKFIADSMLGRLAKWLRLLGFDTLYYPHIEDGRLLHIAREQDRTLLTRDTRLVKRRGVREYMLLTENDPFQQIRKVIKEYDLLALSGAEKKHSLPFPGRCSLCNELLKEIPPEKARPHVPEYTFKTCSRFTYCATCEKVYWNGTHQKNLQKKLSELIQH